MRQQPRTWVSLTIRLIAAGGFAYVAARGVAFGGVLGTVFAGGFLPNGGRGQRPTFGRKSATQVRTSASTTRSA